MDLDFLGLFFVEPGELGSSLDVHPEELVELRVQSQRVASVGSLDEQGHCPHSQRCDRVEIEMTAVENQPHGCVEKYRHECGRMPCSPSNKRGPLRGVRFRRLEYGQVLAWQFGSGQRSRITRR